jgi:hypothetical protein
VEESAEEVAALDLGRWMIAGGGSACTGEWITVIPALRNSSSKRGGELAIAIVDQETHSIENIGEAEVASLSDDPSS